LFCDPDDYYASNALLTLDTKLSSKPDMVVFAAESFEENGNRKAMPPALLPCGENGIAYMSNVFQEEKIFPVAVWQYMYRRTFLHDERLFFREDLAVAEDFDFTFRALEKANSVQGLENQLYFYRIHNAGVSKKPSLKNYHTKTCICVEYFRRYPTASLANMYCYHLISGTTLGSRVALQSVIQGYKANKDILNYVTTRREKIAATMFRLFGYYNGSKIIMMFIRLKHLGEKI